MKAFRTDTSTTGRVVSTLGVLTVMGANMVEDNHLPENERVLAVREVRAILKGHRGVHQSKLVERSIQRCAAGTWN